MIRPGWRTGIEKYVGPERCNDINWKGRSSYANVDEAPLRTPDGIRRASPAWFYIDRNHGRDRDSRHSRRVDRAQDHEPPGRGAPRGGEGGYWLDHAVAQSLPAG